MPDILDAINSALDDYATSDDAMRSAPTLPAWPTSRQMIIARYLCDRTGVDGLAAAVMVADWDENGKFSLFAVDCDAALEAKFRDGQATFLARYRQMSCPAMSLADALGQFARMVATTGLPLVQEET